MLFKEERLRQEFWQLKPKTRYLMCRVDYLFIKYLGKEMVVTCLFYKGGSGVHAAGRAFDIRTVGHLNKDQIEWVKAHINNSFPYDETRPHKRTCIYHKVDKKKIKEYKLENFVPQYHLHFQVWID